MPILYLIATISIFFMYWIDKILIIRYFRITPGYTKWISRNVVRILPLAVLCHCVFGMAMFSYPYILNSELNDGWFGNNTQYFNTKRLGQHHMIVFFIGSIFVIFIILFERPITKLAYALSKCTVLVAIKCCNICRKKKFEEPMFKYGFVYSDDVYREFDFQQLYNEYVKTKKEKQKYRLLKSKGSFSQLELKRYVEKYMTIIERNEKEIYKRLIQLTEDHIDRIEEIDPEMMTPEQKIKTILEYYQQSVDRNNPMRVTFSIDDSMRGRMMNTI